MDENHGPLQHDHIAYNDSRLLGLEFFDYLRPYTFFKDNNIYQVFFETEPTMQPLSHYFVVGSYFQVWSFFTGKYTYK